MDSGGPLVGPGESVYPRFGMAEHAAETRIERRIAPGVIERHTHECGLSLGKRRCTCRPVYRARVSVGAREGRRRYTETFSTLSEAVAWVERAKDISRSGGTPVQARPAPTLRQAAIDFLRRARDGKALSRTRQPYSLATLSSYETVLRTHVLERPEPRGGLPLGELPTDAIDARQLQVAVDGITVDVSGETARIAAAALSTILRDLYGRGILDTPPPRLMLPPPAKRRERHLTPEEADRLLKSAVADDERLGRSLMAPYVALLIATGCRVGEALGLRWGPEGVDLESNPPRVVIGRESTKTDAGARVIPIETEYAEYLERHRAATGNPPNGVLVLADDRGRPLERTGAPRAGLRRVAKAAGLEPLSAHALRHSHGTWGAAAGMSAVTLAARLGHTDPAFTLRRYVHPVQADLEAAPSALEALRRATRIASTARPQSPGPAQAGSGRTSATRP